MASKQGYLIKAPTTGWKTTDAVQDRDKRRRYFVLQGNSLEYYGTLGDTKPKGSITITKLSVIRPIDAYTFLLMPSPDSERKMYVTAESKWEADDWKRTMSLAIGIPPPIPQMTQEQMSKAKILEKDVIMCGYLLKRGGFHGGNKSYKRRYFVLRKDLLYFESEADWEKYRKCEIGKIMEEAPWHVSLNLDMFTSQKRDKHKGCFDFIVNCVNKELVLRASSDDERCWWLSCLQDPLHKDVKGKFLDCLYDRDKEHSRLMRVMKDNAERIAEMDNQALSTSDAAAAAFARANHAVSESTHPADPAESREVFATGTARTLGSLSSTIGRGVMSRLSGLTSFSSRSKPSTTEDSVMLPDVDTKELFGYQSPQPSARAGSEMSTATFSSISPEKRKAAETDASEFSYGD